MTSRIWIEHYPILKKLSQLFFETQKLQAPRYILLPDIKTKDMKNYVIGFSDGLVNFATSCIYLVSCDTNSDKCQASLINTMSKITEDTKANKTLESIVDKDMHGIWLAAANKVKII